MAGLPLPSIQTVTAKVQRSQSSVLGNIFSEDTQVSHGVSGTINFTSNPISKSESVMIILRNTVHRQKRVFKRMFAIWIT